MCAETSTFRDLEFQNFFIWGDKSVTKLTNPNCDPPCRSSDVDSEFEEIECSNIKEWEFLLRKSNNSPFQGWWNNTDPCLAFILFYIIYQLIELGGHLKAVHLSLSSE